MEIDDVRKQVNNWLDNKLNNPYFGSVIAVWVITNRVLLFGVFSFDKDLTVERKITFIHQQLDKFNKLDFLWGFKGFWATILWSFIWGFVAMLFFDQISTLGKASYKFGHRSYNWLLSKVQSSKWVKREQLDEISKQLDDLETDNSNKKIEINSLKKDYDEAINNVTEVKKRNQESLRIKDEAFEGFRKSAFEGKLLENITEVFSPGFQWENVYKSTDELTKGQEVFRCDKIGFIAGGNKRMNIENIKTSINGDILVFDKIADNKRHTNYLIKDSNGNYHGVEGENVIISYRKIINDIIINSAKYSHGDNYIDVTEKIRDLLAGGTRKFNIENNIMGGDPANGQLKKLEIKYTLRGDINTIIKNEHEEIEL